MNTTKITVTQRDEGVTLLEVLARNFSISRKKAKALIDSRAVFVNRKRVWMAKHKVKAGDLIEAGIDMKEANKKPKVDIIYQDNSYLIINKLPGFLSNGAKSIETVMQMDLNIPNLCSVHRLDKDTSGCLIMAMNRTLLEKIIPVFSEHRIEKTYHAIVSGRMTPMQQTINTEIDGKPAVTSIKTIDCNKDASHITVKIRTGRTHQIRKHLKSINHNVLGDRYYSTGKRADERLVQVARQMLHASSIRFESPVTGKDIRARAPLPKDFRNCLKLFDIK